jgi:glycosyltransferase involved in cell wall biosynthesis/LmbE family N-acetylglucosaminyl deacetylase
MPKKTVAVAMIVKNEEALLARCLESVKDADAIYIADTGSIDKTVEIARKYTNNVYLNYVWDDDFSSAQNFIKSKVKEDWILSIDADEYLDCDFSEVRKAIELAKDYVACNMVAEGGHRLEFQFSRLFRNSPDIYWCQRIHKHLNLGGAGEQVGNVRIIFGWSPAHKNDPDRALRVLERVVEEEQDPGRNLYYLGREYWYKKRYKEAVETLDRHVKTSGWDAERAESFLVMSMAFSALGEDDNARYACFHALDLNANFKEAITWMANISKPDNAMQWKRMARTANNRDVLWDREPSKPVHDIIFLATHNDDESLFAAYTLIRQKPLVIVVTESDIQPERGDIGCDADTRKKETIAAMKLASCPVLFLGIKDTELTEENLRERLQYLNPETIYIPALQGGNPQHDLVNKVALEVFGRNKCEQYTTYTKTELYTKGSWEIAPTHQEMELKNKMLDCYVSQLNLPSTKPHFDAVRGKSEWLV